MNFPQKENRMFFLYDSCPSYGRKYLLHPVLQVLKFPMRFSRMRNYLKIVRDRRNENHKDLDVDDMEKEKLLFS